MGKLTIVRWQSKSGEYMVPNHGIDFIDGTSTINGYPTLCDYVHWLAEECLPCFRICVNDKIIWDYVIGYYDEKWYENI